MRILLTATLMVALLATPALAGEEGVTFDDDGTCTEADGTPGLSMADGECVTVADYDEMFSFENLSTIPSQTNTNLSIAEEAGLEPDVPASLRLLGIGVVDEPFTFKETIDGLVML